MKISIYSCSDPYVAAHGQVILEIAREAFDNVPEDAITGRLSRYPEIAIAQDKHGIAGFVFPTPHRQNGDAMVGLRFLTVGNRCRNRGLTTLLVGVVLVRTYVRYLMQRLRRNGPRRLFVLARVCNPKAYYTLTGGNAGVSPAIGEKDPTARVRDRGELYRWMEGELGLEHYDSSTGIIKDGAANAGLRPKVTGISDKDATDWQAYVPVGSEIMVLMPLDWKYMLNNAGRCLRLLKPVKWRRY